MVDISLFLQLQSRTAHPLQGLRRHRRLQRSRRTRSQVLQGSRHRHPWCHHRRQNLRHPRPQRILGQQARRAPHRPLQGHRKVRIRLSATYPRSPWYRHRVGPRPQEAPPDGWYL